MATNSYIVAAFLGLAKRALPDTSTPTPIEEAPAPISAEPYGQSIIDSLMADTALHQQGAYTIARAYGRDLYHAWQQGQWPEAQNYTVEFMDKFKRQELLDTHDLLAALEQDQRQQALNKRSPQEKLNDRMIEAFANRDLATAEKLLEAGADIKSVCNENNYANGTRDVIDTIYFNTRHNTLGEKISAADAEAHFKKWVDLIAKYNPGFERGPNQKRYPNAEVAPPPRAAAIFIALGHNEDYLFDVLLKNKDQVNAVQWPSNASPLIVVCGNGDLVKAKKLIDAGAVINREFGQEGKQYCPALTATMESIRTLEKQLSGEYITTEPKLKLLEKQERCMQVVEFLVQNGANPGGMHLFDAMHTLPTPFVERYIAAAGNGLKNSDRFHHIELFQTTDAEKIRLLVKLGADKDGLCNIEYYNARDIRTVTRLQLALDRGQTAVVKMLAGLAANPDIKSKGKNATTARELADKKGFDTTTLFAAFDALRDNKADVTMNAVSESLILQTTAPSFKLRGC